MRRCISEPTTRFPRPAPRSVATSASTTPSALIRALTGKRQTMLTSVACSRSRQPEPGRGATYLNRNAVQTNRATAVGVATLPATDGEHDPYWSGLDGPIPEPSLIRAVPGRRGDRTSRACPAVPMLSAQTTQTSSISVTEVSRTFGIGRISEFCFMPTEWCVNGTGPPLPPPPGPRKEAEPPQRQDGAVSVVFSHQTAGRPP